MMVFGLARWQSIGNGFDPDGNHVAVPGQKLVMIHPLL
jgi:hypothetical protein